MLDAPRYRCKYIGSLLLCIALMACSDASLLGDVGVNEDFELPGQSRDAYVEIVDAASPEQDSSVSSDAAVADMTIGRDVAVVPEEAIAIETVLSVQETMAGQSNPVSCVVQGLGGLPIDGIETELRISPNRGWSIHGEERSALVGTIAGSYEVACLGPTTGLRDTTPARWDVLPARPTRTRTHAVPGTIEAGRFTSLRCLIADEYGNELLREHPRYAITPEAPGTQIEEGQLQVTQAGRYRVACEVDGAMADAAQLVVTAAPPAGLSIALEPSRVVYSTGQLIEVNEDVRDIYGNMVPGAQIQWEISPPLPRFGNGRFHATVPGRYVLRSNVVGQTHMGRPVSTEIEFLVDGRGPVVNCDAPYDGQLLEAPGAVTLTGVVEDVLQLQSLRVDGALVEVDEAGAFSRGVDARPGINVHHIDAVDLVGNETRTACSYLLVDDLLSPVDEAPDVFMVALGADGLDDGRRGGPFNSLADVASRVLNSNQWVEEIGDALQAQNPLLNSVCLQPADGAQCPISLTVNFQRLVLSGDRRINFEMVEDGIQVNLVLEDVELMVRGRMETAHGVTALNSTLVVPTFRIAMTYGLSAVDGRPLVEHLRTRVLEMPLLLGDFESPVLADLIAVAFDENRSALRDGLVNALNPYLERKVDGLLTSLFGGFGVESLNDGLVVQGFGRRVSELAFQRSFSSAHVEAGGVRLSFGTRIVGPVRQGPGVPGIPVIGLRSAWIDGVDTSVSAAIDSTFFNQLFHALWLEQHFQFEDANAVLALPEDVRSTLRLLLPPVLELRDGENASIVHVGPLEAYVDGLAENEAPIRIRAWARLRLRIVSHGAEEGLGFTEPELDEFWFTMDDVDPLIQVALNTAIRRLIPSMVARAFSGQLPGLPIPEFRLPPELEPFGFRRDMRLRLTEPDMEARGARLEFEGGLGQ